MRLIHSGKVRDVYADGDDLVLVASDRISVYDVVLPTPIPDKGALLTQLSLWWFERLADVTPNHVISAADVPPEWAGRAVRCRRLEMLPVECIARGYLAGSALGEYRGTGSVQGHRLPDGLLEGSRLPDPIFTPSTKEPAGSGRHDRPLVFQQVADRLGEALADDVRRLTLEVYRRGADLAAERGIIIADTKLEFGRTPVGDLLLGDELLTPDSSRFWPQEMWRPGRAQLAYDKQYVRDWAASTGWDRTPPGPELPEEVVAATRARYVAAYERITGRRWP
ncbi:MAG TPA: phosphoribosylaminoimidazolesuccinocarboxamide synthase [Kineosporiaceae bacterium]|nr:phosphoribosylaminoimidazolesuccinocarboxamide synthase [Kineosporiaceae bacterium]